MLYESEKSLGLAGDIDVSRRRVGGRELSRRLSVIAAHDWAWRVHLTGRRVRRGQPTRATDRMRIMTERAAAAVGRPRGSVRTRPTHGRQVPVVEADAVSPTLASTTQAASRVVVLHDGARLLESAVNLLLDPRRRPRKRWREHRRMISTRRASSRPPGRRHRLHGKRPARHSFHEQADVGPEGGSASRSFFCTPPPSCSAGSPASSAPTWNTASVPAFPKRACSVCSCTWAGYWLTGENKADEQITPESHQQRTERHADRQAEALDCALKGVRSGMPGHLGVRSGEEPLLQQVRQICSYL